MTANDSPTARDSQTRHDSSLGESGDDDRPIRVNSPYQWLIDALARRDAQLTGDSDQPANSAISDSAEDADDPLPDEIPLELVEAIDDLDTQLRQLTADQSSSSLEPELQRRLDSMIVAAEERRSPSDHPSIARDQIPGYRLTGTLGAGGMGTVFAAVTCTDNQAVAIKLIPANRSLGIAAWRFEREAAIARLLQSPFIVSALDAGRTSQFHYLVMPRIEGENLNQLICRVGPLSVDEVACILRQAAAGLHEAHIQGIIHRDIKPANIMLCVTGEVKILDLGVGGVFMPMIR
ncbi:MAG: serine/threonine-protein kinase [Pirellulaceae bacterium]